MNSVDIVHIEEMITGGVILRVMIIKGKCEDVVLFLS